jgi:hypothetical protein
MTSAVTSRRSPISAGIDRPLGTGPVMRMLSGWGTSTGVRSSAPALSWNTEAGSISAWPFVS